MYGSVSSLRSIGESGRPSKTGADVNFLVLPPLWLFLSLVVPFVDFAFPDLLLALFNVMFLNPSVATSTPALLADALAVLFLDCFLSMSNGTPGDRRVHEKRRAERKKRKKKKKRGDCLLTDTAWRSAAAAGRSRVFNSFPSHFCH